MDSHEERERREQEDRKDGLQRRQFLQILGGSFAALSLPACDFRAPREKILPYLEQPEEIVPGVASWYATTCGACPARCGMLVKCRDGRPIKCEGNPEHPLSLGGLCARGQATVLDLYDTERLRGPLLGGEPTTWAFVDERVTRALAEAEGKGGGIRLLTRTQGGPAVLRAIEAFSARWPSAKHVCYDTPCAGSILEAHRRTHGEARLPWYRFEKARAIVAFDADFLGTWISPVEYTRAWAAGRRIGKDLTALPWHAQIEPRVSVTGANADLRVPLAPSRQAAAVFELARMVVQAVDAKDLERIPHPPRASGIDAATMRKIADRLTANPGRALIVSGSASVAVQTAVNLINQALGNYGTTLDLTQPSLQCQGSDEALDTLIDEMNAGQVRGLVLLDANPGYHHPRAGDFLAGLAKVDFSVSLAQRRDETAEKCSLVAPDHHALESWADAHPHVGVYSLFQPVLAPLWSTRSAIESLLAWAGAPATAYAHLQRTWKDQIFVKQDVHRDFQAFWDRSLHDGVFVLAAERLAAPAAFDAGALLKGSVAHVPDPPGELEFVGFAGVALGNGDLANNPWLQELPDPLTKATWGNCASMSPKTARKLGVVEGRRVELTAAGRSVRLPAQVQPGMPDGVVAAALGYGRAGAGKIAANYPLEKMFAVDQELCGGADVYPLLRAPFVQVRTLDGLDPLAKSQTYDHQVTPLTGHDRPLVLHTLASDLAKQTGKGEAKHDAPASLWADHAYAGNKWAMAIDLNACTGCSACTIACMAENNVPVVGKAEIRKSRDMFWLRIDRYYEGSPDATPDSPEVWFMPMLCAHCDRAPCETVCPVLATLHSSEGLNMQVYNRCVGTRYCANNCPYKVRRFNWFDYAHQDLVQNLVLNPDVAVRTRGVMEKCSFCVQRISEARVRAKGENRAILDGEVKPACVQSCPSEAIVFGNVNDPRSKVAKAFKDPRAYAVLEEIGVGPSVRYLKRVKNDV